MKYIHGLMKELPSPWKPVAICHSHKSCCKLRTNVSCWRRERGLLRVPWSLLTCGSPSPDPAMLLHSRHFDNWLDMWVGILRLWRVNYNTWQPLIWFRGLALYVFCPPSPLRYWKDEKERWWWRCYLWGEPCFPNGNCTFCWILCSLW